MPVKFIFFFFLNHNARIENIGPTLLLFEQSVAL